MSNNIILKKSSVGDKVPLASDLEHGELALNFADGNLFFKNSSNTVATLASTKFVSATGNVTGGNVITAGQVSATGNVTGNFFQGNGSQLTGINAFGTVTVAGQSNVAADSTSDTLTLTAGAGITILTDADTDTITITSVAIDSIFATGGDMGTVEEAVTAEQDLGLITSSILESYNLGTIILGGLIHPDQFVLPSFTVAELGNTVATPAGQMVFCVNDTGGAIPAFSDGTDWRRVTDRAVIS